MILKHYKVVAAFPVEHSVCPHDIYDWWVEKYGRNLQAFWPVVDTEIGRMGIMMANEGSYPETHGPWRLNGAEVVYRASYPHPATGNEIFEIQSRGACARQQHVHRGAQLGTLLSFSPKRRRPSTSSAAVRFIINYKGQISRAEPHTAAAQLRGWSDRHRSLRDHRARAQWDNWLKDLRTELYQILYEQPIYPKNSI